MDEAPCHRVVSLVRDVAGCGPVPALAGVESALIDIVVCRAQDVDNAGPPLAVREHALGVDLADRLHHDDAALPGQAGGEGVLGLRRKKSDKNGCGKKACASIRHAVEWLLGQGSYRDFSGGGAAAPEWRTGDERVLSTRASTSCTGTMDGIP